MRVAITGAGGYVGGRLVSAMTAAGTDVRAIVRRRRPWLGADQIELDLSDAPAASVVDAVAGMDAVVHLAGASEAAPDQALGRSTTIAMADRVAEAVLRAEVPRVVYLSTVHVYGAQAMAGAVLQEDTPPEPLHPYAEARLECERRLASALGDRTALVVLRLTNSVGAPAHPSVDRWTLVANDLCRQAVATGELRLRTPGTQWRDFIDLGDACAAIATASAPSVPGGTYNLGSGQPMTVRHLAGLVQEAAAGATGAWPPLIAPDPEPHPPARHTVAVDRRRRVAGGASTPVERSIAETVRFCLDQRRPSDG